MDLLNVVGEAPAFHAKVVALMSARDMVERLDVGLHVVLRPQLDLVDMIEVNVVSR